MRNIVLGLVIIGCSGHIPLQSQFDISDSDSESEVFYTDEELYLMVVDYPMETIDKDIIGNNNVGLTSFCGEGSFTGH